MDQSQMGMNGGQLTEQERKELEQRLLAMSEEEVIGVFVESMMKEKGMEGVSEEARAEHKKVIVEQVERAIMAGILMALPEDTYKSVQAAINEGKMDEARAMIDGAKLPMDEITEKAMMGVRAVYLGEKE